MNEHTVQTMSSSSAGSSCLCSDRIFPSFGWLPLTGNFSVCVCACIRMCVIFEGIDFVMVLVGFGRLAENRERQTANVRSWHQTVRGWGHPGGSSVTHSLTHSHTQTRTICKRSVTSLWETLKHTRTTTNFSLGSSSDRMHNSTAFNKIIFQAPGKKIIAITNTQMFSCLFCLLCTHLITFVMSLSLHDTEKQHVYEEQETAFLIETCWF